MTQSAQNVRSLLLDTQGRLVEELPCLHCGYLLRGRRMDESCPECGKAVAESARNDLLQFMPRAWLVCVRRGLRTIVAWVLSVFLALGLLLVSILIAFSTMGSSDWDEFVTAVVVISTVAPVLLFALGTWLSTHRPDLPRVSSRARVAAGLARYVSVAASAGIVLIWVAEAISPGRYPFLAKLIKLSWFGLILAGPVALVSLLSYLSALALRLPSQSMARQSRGLAWALAFLTLVVFGSYMLGVAYWGLAASGGSSTVVMNVPPPPAPTAAVTHTQTTNEPDGSIRVHTIHDDGTSVTQTTWPDGTRQVVTVDANQSVTTVDYDPTGNVVQSNRTTFSGPSGQMTTLILIQSVTYIGLILTVAALIWVGLLAFAWQIKLSRCMAATPVIMPFKNEPPA